MNFSLIKGTNIRVVLSSLLFLLTPLLVFSLSSAATAKTLDESKIKQRISRIFGGVDGARISLNSSEIKDVYIFNIEGKFGLISADGKYYFSGDAWNIDTRENVVDSVRNKYNLERMKTIDPALPVTFKAKNEKAFVWVFTDIDCFYCRKLHSEITQINNLGISVRYVSFPRSGDRSARDWRKAAEVWCSKDRMTAMTRSKLGQDVSSMEKRKNCSPNIALQYGTGVSIGVRGTPGIVLENGKLSSSYVPAQRLAQMAIEATVR